MVVFLSIADYFISVDTIGVFILRSASLNHRRFSAITAALLLLIIALFMPARAKAMDPVTMAVLAPVAVRGAEVTLPYVVRSLQCGGVQMLKMGIDIVDILRLPVGVLQSTIGAPIGLFDQGIHNVCTGFMSPFKLAWDALLLPVAMTGIAPP
jgi:hypothetical protein